MAYTLDPFPPSSKVTVQRTQGEMNSEPLLSLVLQHKEAQQSFACCPVTSHPYPAWPHNSSPSVFPAVEHPHGCAHSTLAATRPIHRFLARSNHPQRSSHHSPSHRKSRSYTLLDPSSVHDSVAAALHGSESTEPCTSENSRRWTRNMA